MTTLTVLAFALAGGLWRWIDGRGYGPNWARMASLGILSILALYPICILAFLLGIIFSAIWVLKQKQREEYDDMLLRWCVPFGIFGIVLAATVGNVLPFPVMTAAGALVAALVVMGTKVQIGKLDPSAVAEALSGFVAFGALAFSARVGF